MIKECRKESKSKAKWYHGNWKRIQPASKTAVCEWTWKSRYLTSCGKIFVCELGDIQENNFRFCPYCGKPIKEVVG